MSRTNYTAEDYDGEPVRDRTYFNSREIGVDLPDRHVHPAVRLAVETFVAILGAARQTEVERDEAETNLVRLKEMVAAEHYGDLLRRGRNSDRLTPEQASVPLSEAQHTAEALGEMVHGARGAMAEAHVRLVQAVVDSGEEWERYLSKQAESCLARVENARNELLDALVEAEDVEGLRRLIAAGGVHSSKNHGSRRRVAPHETEAKIHVVLVRDAVAAAHDAIKGLLKQSASHSWVATE